jgi:hypothetical protein
LLIFIIAHIPQPKQRLSDVLSYWTSTVYIRYFNGVIENSAISALRVPGCVSNKYCSLGIPTPGCKPVSVEDYFCKIGPVLKSGLISSIDVVLS